jgi:NAD(P)-dependent dehydrogenase (short-subunit alcohol dehydrogenase family)
MRQANPQSSRLLSFGLSTLIITSRSPQKGEEVGSRLRAQFPAATIKFWPLSLDSYPSIQAFAALANKLERLDIAILNAGMQIADFVLIPETAHETLVQVNYLSTFLLGILLLPILKAKSPAGTPGRLSIVSSGSARGATLSIPKDKTVLGTLDDQTLPWKPVERYAVSKLLGHLFIINLASYIDPEDVVVNLVDPGLVKGTDLQGLAPWHVAAFFWAFKAVLGRTVGVGGSTYLDAVVAKGKESHGSLVANWRISS